MGAWGVQPWECDAAADWFAEIFEQTALAQRIEQALQLDIDDHHEEIRAAAYLLRLLGRTYIWPVHEIDRHRKLAADRLQAVLDSGVLDDYHEFVEAVRSEIAELRKPG